MFGSRRRRSVLLGLSQQAAANARDLAGSGAREQFELLPRQIAGLSLKQSEEEEFLEDAENDDMETINARKPRSLTTVFHAASMAGFMAAAAVLWAIVGSGSGGRPWSMPGATQYQPLLES